MIVSDSLARLVTSSCRCHAVLVPIKGQKGQHIHHAPSMRIPSHWEWKKRQTRLDSCCSDKRAFIFRRFTLETLTRMCWGLFLLRREGNRPGSGILFLWRNVHSLESSCCNSLFLVWVSLRCCVEITQSINRKTETNIEDDTPNRSLLPFASFSFLDLWARIETKKYRPACV